MPPSVLLEAHDAAMVYLPTSSPLCAQFKTQTFLPHVENGLSRLLDCGARVLDLRLKLCSTTSFSSQHHGIICFHHDVAEIKRTHSFEIELQKLVHWIENNPTELVILKLVPQTFSHSLIDLITKQLEQYNIMSVSGLNKYGCWGSKSKQTNLHRDIVSENENYVDALSRKQKGLIAIWKFNIGTTGQSAKESCVEDNFIPKNGYNPLYPQQSFSSLQEHIQNITQRKQNSSKKTNWRFQEIQILWQSTNTREHYFASDSSFSILRSNNESKLNSWIKNEAVENILNNVNEFSDESDNIAIYGIPKFWLKLDNFCSYGQNISLQTGTKMTNEQFRMCRNACGITNQVVNDDLIDENKVNEQNELLFCSSEDYKVNVVNYVYIGLIVFMIFFVVVYKKIFNRVARKHIGYKRIRTQV